MWGSIRDSGNAGAAEHGRGGGAGQPSADDCYIRLRFRHASKPRGLINAPQKQTKLERNVPNNVELAVDLTETQCRTNKIAPCRGLQRHWSDDFGHD